jgi:hypothetical protein
MEESFPSFLVAFLLPFHVAGGAAIGAALRRAFQGGFSLSKLLSSAFLFVWGTIFGGVPLVFGLAMGQAWFILLELVVFLGAIVVIAIGYDWLRNLYSHPGMFIASFGLVFFVIGVAVAVSLLASGDASGILFGLIFGGVGGGILIAGILMLLRT